VPELPEVETTRRGLLAVALGRRIARILVRNRALRWPVTAGLERAAAGERIEAIDRRAKYLLLACGRAGRILVHLGMSGRLWVVPAAEPAGRHDHVDIVLDDGIALRLRDPRRFGAVLWLPAGPEAPPRPGASGPARADTRAAAGTARSPRPPATGATHARGAAAAIEAGLDPRIGIPVSHPLLDAIGPEPLEPDFDGDYLYRATRARSAAIKLVLMDSHVVAGVGNIYANEALFAAGIHPRTPARRVGLARCERLVAEVRAVLARAIDAGGSSLRDYVASDGQAGRFQDSFSVYDRAGEPCMRCASPVRLIRQAARSTFYCARCQR
jgi:formamidopyrimidine-DNA glycosylase